MSLIAKSKPDKVGKQVFQQKKIMFFKYLIENFKLWSPKQQEFHTGGRTTSANNSALLQSIV